jgi:hypothetical protein
MADLSDLDGCRLKLARADQHLKALDQEIDWFLKRNPQLFTHERNAQTGEDLLWTLTRTNPPDEWSCIVGDVLYNLRSCLDHLAWQLVLLAGNEPSTDTQFPVFKADPFAPGAKRDLLKLWERRVKGMDGRDVAKLKELQPYSGRNIDLLDHALLLLHDLNIWDKHRQLHLGAQQFRYGGFELDLTNPKSRSEFEITPIRTAGRARSSAAGHSFSGSDGNED